MGMLAQRLHRASRQTLEQCTKAVGTSLAPLYRAFLPFGAGHPHHFFRSVKPKSSPADSSLPRSGSRGSLASRTARKRTDAERLTFKLVAFGAVYGQAAAIRLVTERHATSVITEAEQGAKIRQTDCTRFHIPGTRIRPGGTVPNTRTVIYRSR